MFRIAVLRGLRRGELCGLRWASADLEAGVLVVDHTILELDGHLVDGVPRTAAGVRRVYLDAETAELLRAARRGPLVIIEVQQRGLDVIAASSGPGAKPEPDRPCRCPAAGSAPERSGSTRAARSAPIAG
jgi:hypothetical protein